MHHFIGLNYKNELIQSVQTIKTLGLIIDHKLTWNEHLKQIKNKISTISYVIYRAKKFTPKKQLYMIYHSHFLSHILYLNPIWNICSQTYINQIQRIQNKVIKTIEGFPRNTPTNSLYKNTLNIEKISKLQTVLLIKKIQNKMIKANFNFNTVERVQRYQLRNIVNLRPLLFKKTKHKNSIQSAGIKIYNEIPNNIKEISNIRHFKKEVITFLLGNISN